MPLRENIKTRGIKVVANLSPDNIRYQTAPGASFDSLTVNKDIPLVLEILFRLRYSSRMLQLLLFRCLFCSPIYCSLNYSSNVLLAWYKLYYIIKVKQNWNKNVHQVPVISRWFLVCQYSYPCHVFSQVIFVTFVNL